MTPGTDVVMAGTVLRGLLDSAHRSAGDFSVIVPAELLAEQQRTKRLFEFIMVAIASISLSACAGPSAPRAATSSASS